MPAYVITHIRVRDAARYEEYKRLAQASILAHGGRYVARGGQVEILEGPWNPERLMLLEFASMDAARRWWNSDDYRAAAAVRRAVSDGELVLLEGLDVPIG